MIRRSWLSIKRKRSKTIIMFIIMFIISNLVLAAIAIKNATEESMQFAKESLGGEVYLNANMEKLRSDMKTQMEEIDPSERREQMQNFERPTVYVETVNAIKDSKYLSDYSYSVNTSANASTFEVLETSNDQNSNQEGRGGPSFEPSSSMGDIQIEAVTAYRYIDGVTNKTITLTSGESFDETSENETIISYELATLNDLSIGDTITLSKIDTEETVTLTIKGIYDTSEEEDQFSRMMANSGNKIYVNIKTGVQFLSDDDYNDGNYAVSNATFYLANPNNLEAFLAETKANVPTLEEDNLTLDINTNAYDTMVGPIEGVGSFATTILIIVVIAAVVIISLIINTQIKERNYEMGVLMSLGETKKKILGQIIIELLVISTVGFVLSTGTSFFVAKKWSQNLLTNQIEMAEKQSQNNFGRPMGNSNQLNQGSSSAEIIDEININMDALSYLKLFGIGYLIVIVSMTLPAVNIMKYEPKTILTRRGA